MRFLKCPESERLFEFVTIPREIPRLSVSGIKLHAMTCEPCRGKIEGIRSKWNSYFKPEPEITSSLIKVYSRLQNDETLILRGWKLGEQRPRTQNWLSGGWLFRGSVAMGVASILGVVIFTQVTNADRTLNASHNNTSSVVPYAQIRMEDKNRIQVQYVRPELLESMEFQTNESPGRQVSVGSGLENLK